MSLIRPNDFLETAEYLAGGRICKDWTTVKQLHVFEKNSQNFSIYITLVTRRKLLLCRQSC